MNRTRKKNGAWSAARRFVPAYFVAFASYLAAPAPARASQADVDALAQARDRILTSAATLDKDYQFAYDDSMPLALTFIDTGKSANISVFLQEGVKYTFAAAGDNDATDVDVYVRDSRGKYVSQDQDDNALAMTVFKPAKSDYYTVTIGLAGSKTSSSACGLGVFRDTGGYAVDNTSVREVTDFMFKITEENFKKSGSRYRCWTDHFAVIGKVLRPGDKLELEGLQALAGHSTFIGCGDSKMHQILLKVRRDNATSTAGDKGPSRALVHVLDLTAGEKCTLEITNMSSRGPSLVLYALGVE